MDLIFNLMFRSPYDRASLAVMVVGLAIHAVIDLARKRGANEADTRQRAEVIAD